MGEGVNARVVPQLLVTRTDAAKACAMSMDSWERYVQPHVRLVRRGRLRLVPVTELERWIAENAERTL
jgi:hypothetical protein